MPCRKSFAARTSPLLCIQPVRRLQAIEEQTVASDNLSKVELVMMMGCVGELNRMMRAS
jgi:hypothetical protein